MGKLLQQSSINHHVTLHNRILSLKSLSKLCFKYNLQKSAKIKSLDNSAILADTKKIDTLPIFAYFLFDDLQKISWSHFLSLIIYALILVLNHKFGFWFTAAFKSKCFWLLIFQKRKKLVGYNIGIHILWNPNPSAKNEFVYWEKGYPIYCFYFFNWIFKSQTRLLNVSTT